MELKEKERQSKDQIEELNEKLLNQNAEIQNARLIVQEAEGKAKKAEDALFEVTKSGSSAAAENIYAMYENSNKPTGIDIRSSTASVAMNDMFGQSKSNKKIEDLQAKLKRKEQTIIKEYKVIETLQARV